jgi:4-hydroxy-tetrahydrodipicolinate synthase
MRNLSKERFTGVLAPVVTPFTQALEVDKARLLQHCRWLLAKDVGLAVFGTNSEANSLSTDEKIELLHYLVDNGIAPDRMMPGTGCCALPDSVRLTSEAVKLGCKGALMLPPFYYKGVSDDGLFASYAEIIERVGSADLQIYLYHIPPIAQIPLSIALINKLVKRYPNAIAGIKDSSGDWEKRLALLTAGWENFRVFCGSESFLLANMRHGGAGCISATANVNPAAIHELFSKWQSPDAEILQDQLNVTRQLIQAYPMIPALKSTIAICAQDDAWHAVRPPLTALSADLLAQLKSDLTRQGFNMPNLTELAR